MKIKIILAFFAISLISVLYYYIKSIENELESTKKDLSNAVNANISLEIANKNLKERHLKELKAVGELNEINENLLKGLADAKDFIYKSNENNLTKLFNELTFRLWSEKSSNH